MSWGNRLLITFIVFGAGIIYLVYRSMHTNFELVEKEYYKSELRYQEVIDGSNRANGLSAAVSLKQTVNGLVLQLPNEMKDQVVTGTILFYCAYDASKDRNVGLAVNTDGMQVLENGSVAPGDYTVKIRWVTNGQNYYTEKSITIT